MAELVFFSGTMDCGKSTLALQMDHNHRARPVGLIFTKMDRMGESVLSSRLGLSTDATRSPTTSTSGTPSSSTPPPGTGSTTSSATRRSSTRPARWSSWPRSSTRWASTSSPSASPRTSGHSSGSRRMIELADRVQVLQVEALCWWPAGHPQRPGRRRRHGRRGRAGRGRRHQARPGRAGRVRGALPPPLHAPHELRRRPRRGRLDLDRCPSPC